MERKELGKIQKARWGLGGYQDCQVGFAVTLGGPSWGVCDFWGAWATKHSESCKWTETDRKIELGDAAMRVVDLLNKAHVLDVKDLEGIPVEVTFDGQRLKSWRLLDEVL